MPAARRNGLALVQATPAISGLITSAVKASMPKNASMPAAMATSVAISGATTSALATFDSTVAVSEIGIDFQNSTLRSRRSS